tara:strand:+ start:115 stop:477 length:363 start_codon:yes stop_codon:yes gene_type:complete
MKKIIGLTLLIAGLAGCNQSNPAGSKVESRSSVTSTEVASPTTAQMRLWSSSCALCHVTGQGGAPRIGNQDEWSPRTAQGIDVLLEHTLNGYNNMPPLGYCMACEASDFVALIEFMGAEK